MKKLNDRIIENWSSYSDYCNSNAFLILKNVVLKYHKHICFCCGNKASTIHHKVYKKWGTELISDCVPVCYVCHKLIHQKNQIEHYKPLKFKNALLDYVQNLYNNLKSEK